MKKEQENNSKLEFFDNFSDFEEGESYVSSENGGIDSMKNALDKLTSELLLAQKGISKENERHDQLMKEQREALKKLKTDIEEGNKTNIEQAKQIEQQKKQIEQQKKTDRVSEKTDRVTFNCKEEKRLCFDSACRA